MEPKGGGLRTEGIAEKSEVCDGWDELRNRSLDRLKGTRTIEGDILGRFFHSGLSEGNLGPFSVHVTRKVAKMGSVENWKLFVCYRRIFRRVGGFTVPCLPQILI